MTQSKNTARKPPNQPRGTLVDQRELDVAGGGFTVDAIEAVFRKARVERSDVGGVVEVDATTPVVVADPRHAIRWYR